MCFPIPRRQRPWKNRRVYKVVRKWHGYNRSYYSGPHYPQLGYAVGEFTLAGDCTGKLRPIIGCNPKYHYPGLEGSPRAWEGIYVYRTVAAARRHTKNRERDFLIAVFEVDPRDFLVHNSNNLEGTYRKVLMVGFLKRKRRKRRAK
jgi:hypothetical protein